MLLITADKDLGYQIGYWITAFLPVLLGFGLTMLLIWYFTKTYKGKDDDFNSEFDDDDN
jgi:hypothetical protein